MRVRVAVAVVALTALVSTAEAGIFHRNKKSLPKPMTPGMSDKVQQDHKPGNQQRHSARFDNPAWGDVKHFLKLGDPHLGHSVTDQE